MSQQRGVTRLRERFVVGHLRDVLGDAEVTAWAHVCAPEHGHHGIVLLTPANCIIHWTTQHADLIVAWEEVTAWHVHEETRGGPVLTLHTQAGEVAVRLPMSSKGRVRKASAVLDAVARYAPAADPDARGGVPDVDMRVERRGVRGHVRRVGVTVVGVLVILVGVLFASPFVPGPGMLTVLAGLAILASEYDWAREVHHWLKRKVDRLRQRFRAWRRRRRSRKHAGAGAAGREDSRSAG